MRDLSGVPLPHFTPHPSPVSSGVNLFAQDLSSDAPFMEHPYIFPPIVLVGPVLRFLQSHQRSCTLVTLDVYPRKYWWPLVQRYAVKARKLARKGDTMALLVPSRNGWVSHHGIPGAYGFSHFISLVKLYLLKCTARFFLGATCCPQ